jgi:hypothetical protein
MDNFLKRLLSATRNANLITLLSSRLLYLTTLKLLVATENVFSRRSDLSRDLQAEEDKLIMRSLEQEYSLRG